MSERMCTCFECMANIPEPTDEEIIAGLSRTVDRQAAELEALRGFAIWLTGCGYDFTQHQYFLDNQHLLIGESPMTVNESA